MPSHCNAGYSRHSGGAAGAAAPATCALCRQVARPIASSFGKLGARSCHSKHQRIPSDPSRYRQAPASGGKSSGGRLMRWWQASLSFSRAGQTVPGDTAVVALCSTPPLQRAWSLLSLVVECPSSWVLSPQSASLP
ncbi:hypothetical protein HaLaN_29648 [Haematococcus lacustris]|uniref:Uncharacterized protein n=1 Tax=Haematococcus lacustris TaxID=44745 RepID=A0A6A0ADF4_HAELA|nr:hypothetical protein HaLaN_29648 [Haematococcus lacustris]